MSSPLLGTCSSIPCWHIILYLMIISVHGVFTSSGIGAPGLDIPMHSNFLRTALRGGRGHVWCANDPTVCLDCHENPWGGNTCCFNRFCKDNRNDRNHCGGCAVTCAHGLACCDGQCVNVRNHPHHCGSCYEVCPRQLECSFEICGHGFRLQVIQEVVSDSPLKIVFCVFNPTLIFANLTKTLTMKSLVKLIEAPCVAHPTANVFINFASFRSAYASSMAALKQPTIRVIAIIAKGVPESNTKQLIAFAKANNKVVIGHATVGGIQAGAFMIGDTAGTIDNIIKSKLYRPGSVEFVSKSGGMSNEHYNTIARVIDGIYEGIAIGEDVFPGSTLSDHILRFNYIPQIK